MDGFLLQPEEVTGNISMCKKGRVTVPSKMSDDLAPGSLNRILKQAKLK